MRIRGIGYSNCFLPHGWVFHIPFELPVCTETGKLLVLTFKLLCHQRPVFSCLPLLSVLTSTKHRYQESTWKKSTGGKELLCFQRAHSGIRNDITLYIITLYIIKLYMNKYNRANTAKLKNEFVGPPQHFVANFMLLCEATALVTL